MSDKISINDELNTVVLNNVNQNIIITTDGVDSEVTITQPTTNIVIVNESTPSITIVENNVQESYNDQVTVTESTIQTSIVQVAEPERFVLVINTPGPAGPPGIEGPPGTIDGVDVGAFVLTSSFNLFTSSYYSDSASFDSRINNISVNVDFTGYTTTSSFNAFTSSYNTGSFTGSLTGRLFGTASWATNSTTSSYVTASNVYGPYGQNSIRSSSYAVQAQNSTIASTANQSEAVLVYGYNTHENGVEYSFLIPRAYNISPGDEAQSALVSNDDFTYTSFDSGTPVFSMPVSSSTFIIGVEGEESASLVVHGEVKATKFTTLTNTIEFTDLITSGSRAALLTLSVSSSNLVVSGGGIFSNITGSLLGTASFAQSSSTALTASFLPIGTYNVTSSWANNYNETDPVFTAKSGSFTTTSSFNSFTSSYTTGSFTGSFIGEFIGTSSWSVSSSNAVSSSYALTASYALNAGGSGVATLIDSIGARVYTDDSFITAGSKGYKHIPYNADIVKTRTIANTNGFIDVNIKRNGTTLGTITLSNQSASLDTTLSGWTTTLNEDDLIEFYVSQSSTYITDISIFIDIQST